MKYLFFVILLVGLNVTGCKKDDSTPIVDENGLTPEINDLISEENLDALLALGFDLNGGANPPKLEGEYVINPCYFAGSSAGDQIGSSCPDFFLNFYGQRGNEITVDFRHGTQIGEGIGSYIVGTDCDFSVFVSLDEEYTPTGEQANAVYGITGKLLTNGISDLAVANLMLDNGGNPNGIWIEEGTGRLFKDRDEFAQRQGSEDQSQWFYTLPDCPCEYTQDIDGRTESCGQWEDCNSASNDFHYGATYEVRWYSDQEGQPGQQCTYDASRNLITAGIAAGSPDLVSPGGCGYGDFINSAGITLACRLSEHCLQDVKPWLSGNDSSIPCWQYLRDWPANTGDGCNGNNPVSDIAHMLNMIGNMTCEEATIIIKSAAESPNLLIDSELRSFIIGETLSIPDVQLIAKLENWKALKSCNLFPSDELCLLIDRAIANLR